MALSLLSREVSDLCIGKPALRWLPLSATVADALSALRRSGKNWISIWNCEHYAGRSGGGVSVGDCRCVSKVCLADVVCFLCREDNLVRPLIALESPVSVLIRKVPELVKHLEPNSRFHNGWKDGGAIFEGTSRVTISYLFILTNKEATQNQRTDGRQFIL